MTTVMMDVADIRFTQEHVYDTFNANSEKAGSVIDLMEAILAGEKTPSDLPLIRVAAKKGAYWCVDNRRLFTYKHCQLGKIPVQVFNWKDNREFELKYKNGLPFRQQTSNGLRAGLIQRSDVPFPRTPVAEPSLSKFRVHLSPAQQRQHEAKIAALKKKREESASSDRESVKSADALRDLLQQSAPEAAPSKAKTKKKAKGKQVQKRAACKEAEQAETVQPCKRRKKMSKQAKKETATVQESSGKLTLTMEQEDSDDEAFAVEIMAPP
eukprot:TRINITY_DN76302_c0_g1_i1.p1 TRINITY_DN76302_c0_g1~~TRINITY_DN76302_c0_g1_i1.p1  ORF type:complete len:268 (+),score=88.25 TRINITY_DN76302_c0_g1_i1:56-859(+)